MLNRHPIVSILIPCRNEEKFIEQCLNSIIANNYPKDNLEILVIDGTSVDQTRAIVRKISQEHLFIKLITNPARITPTALNIGIQQSQGKIIMRLDAHTVYPVNYISKCVNYLIKHKADNVGGVIKTTADSNAFWAQSIVASLSHSFGIGNSKFRAGVTKPQEVDTVPFGCYKRKVFNKIGLFNKNLKRSQDIEFNLRLKRAGGKILLCPDIVSYYYARSTLKQFIKHNFINGIWAIYPLKFVKMPLSLRHYIPAIFVSGLIVGGILAYFIPAVKLLYFAIIGLYLILTLVSSLQISIKEKNFLYLFTMPLIFATLHLSYGVGSLVGLIKILLPTEPHHT
jgi:cellulose synthase/poly-beta-1,6-N-acetylglucosamine synthase-like glycosyltransferase